MVLVPPCVIAKNEPIAVSTAKTSKRKQREIKFNLNLVRTEDVFPVGMKKILT